MTSIIAGAASAAQGAMHDIASIVTGKMEKNFDPSQLVVVSQAESHFSAHAIGMLLKHHAKVRAVANDESGANMIRKAFSGMPEATSRLEVIVCSNMCDDDACHKVLHDAVYLIHPVAMNPNHFKGNAEEDMLKPSIDGTKCMLRRAQQAGTVKKVCIISNCYALGDVMKTSGHVYNQDSWLSITREDAAKITDVHELFQACNALAEKSAWDFVHSIPDKPPFEMVALLPSYVVGPEVIPVGARGPNKMICHALSGKECCPIADMGFVDARDVAHAACICLQSSEAKMKRYILTAGYYTYADMIQWARDIAGIAPSEQVKAEKHKEKPNKYDTGPTEKDLAIKYTPIEKSVTEMLAQCALNVSSQTQGGDQGEFAGSRSHASA